jgi:hypothetical protein
MERRGKLQFQVCEFFGVHIGEEKVSGLNAVQRSDKLTARSRVEQTHVDPDLSQGHGNCGKQTLQCGSRTWGNINSKLYMMVEKDRLAMSQHLSTE